MDFLWQQSIYKDEGMIECIPKNVLCNWITLNVTMAYLHGLILLHISNIYMMLLVVGWMIY